YGAATPPPVRLLAFAVRESAQTDGATPRGVAPFFFLPAGEAPASSSVRSRRGARAGRGGNFLTIRFPVRHLAEVQLRDLRIDLAPVTDDHDEHPLRHEVTLRDVVDVGRLERVEAAGKGAVVVERKIVHVDRSDRSGRARRRLEIGRQRSDGRLP